MYPESTGAATAPLGQQILAREKAEKQAALYQMEVNDRSERLKLRTDRAANIIGTPENPAEPIDRYTNINAADSVRVLTPPNNSGDEMFNPTNTLPENNIISPKNENDPPKIVVHTDPAQTNSGIVTTAQGRKVKIPKDKIVVPRFLDASGKPMHSFNSLEEALQAGEDAARAAQAQSGNRHEYGVATKLGPKLSDGTQTYLNSVPVTSEQKDGIMWNTSHVDNLIALNHLHTNDLGFSDQDKSSFHKIYKNRSYFTGIYMFDNRGNHRYGNKTSGWFGKRTVNCGGPNATGWDCPE